MAAPVGAGVPPVGAAPAVPFVHPIPDHVYLRMHKDKHEEGKDETWKAFTRLAGTYADELQASYVLTRDPITRGNQIAALGYVQARIDTDQARIYNYLVNATAHYASAEIDAVDRGTPDCGSRLWDLLCLRHRAEDASTRIAKKEELEHFALNGFKHDEFEVYFDTLANMWNAVNQLAAPGAGQVVDEESLVSRVLRGVARDQRYAATVTSIRLAAAPPDLLQLKASLKRTYMAIKAETRQASDAAHMLGERGKCPYPGCGSQKHELSACPLKAADLKLRREAQDLRRGGKGGSSKAASSSKDVVCGYKPCGKKGHQERNCWLKKRHEREAKEKPSLTGKEGREKKKSSRQREDREDANAASERAAGPDEDSHIIAMKLYDIYSDEDLEEAIMVDSGTSCHITPHRRHLINLRPCNKTLGQVGKQILQVRWMGDMPVIVKRVSEDGSVTYIKLLLRDVYLVGEASKALISVKRAKKSGFIATFADDGKEGFHHDKIGFLPFVEGPNGLSYLPVKYECHNGEQAMLAVEGKSAGNDADTESDSESDDDVPDLLDSDSSDDDEAGAAPPKPAQVERQSKKTEESDSDSDSDGPPALMASDSESDDDDGPPVSAAGNLSAQQRRAINAANDEYYQRIALKHHVRCGHTNLAYLRSVATTVDGLEELQQLPLDFKMKPCPTCMTSKSRAQPVKHKAERSKVVHHLVHSDTTGKMRVRSSRGNRYASVFVDCASNYKHVKCHPLKSDYPRIYKERNIEAGRAPSILRTDGAGEMTSADFEQSLLHDQTFHQKSVPYSQFQNGRAEAAIRTVSTRARTLMADSALPAKYWDYAMEAAAHLENTTQPHAPGSTATAYERFHGRAPAGGFLRPFGCYAVAHLGKSRVKDGKLSDRGRPGVHLGLGFTDGFKAYRLLDVKTGEVFHSAPSMTTFDEAYFPCRPGASKDRWPRLDLPSAFLHIDVESAESDTTPADFEPYILRSSTAEAALKPTPPPTPPLSLAPTLSSAPSRTPSVGGAADQRASRSATPSSIRTESVVSMSQLPHTYPVAGESTTNDNDPTAWTAGMGVGSDYFDENMSAHAAHLDDVILDDTPTCLEDAKNSPYWPQWKKALAEERAALEKRGVWKSVDSLPPGAKLLQAKVVYKQKKNKDGQVYRFKCRCTAKGFSQVELVHYYDTFAAVAAGSYVRTCLSLAVANKMKIRHLDVVTAFLYPFLLEKLHMMVPEDIAKFPGEMVELVRSIYGTKQVDDEDEIEYREAKLTISSLVHQAAHNWWKELTAALRSFGLQAACDEETIFVITSGTTKLIVVTFVDDLIVIHDNDQLFRRFVNHLKRRFEITDEGELEFYLGVLYEQDADNWSMKASQKAYIERLAETFGGDTWHPAKTPMEENFVVRATDLDEHPPAELVTRYRKLLGSLLFLACWSRPDISVAVGKLARWSTCCTEKLYSSLKRILRYVIATKDRGITWTGNEDVLKATGHARNELYAYVDSAYADCPITRRSTMGYTIMLNGAVVSWRSKRQPIVALSTAEAEYIAACYAAQEIVALRTLLDRLGFRQQNPTCCYEDNQACILLAGEPVFRERSKHIDVRWHFVREATRNFILQLVPCSTHNMIADALTKPLGWVKFLKFIEMIMNFKHNNSA